MAIKALCTLQPCPARLLGLGGGLTRALLVALVLLLVTVTLVTSLRVLLLVAVTLVTSLKVLLVPFLVALLVVASLVVLLEA